MQGRFTSNEVSRLTGMSARQLQWWDECGLVIPAREGHRRLYSFDDLADVAVIGQLRARGFSLQRVRRVMRFLQREFGRRLGEIVGSGSDYHLLTDGNHIYLETSPQQALDTLKNARQPMFAICLSDAVRQVRADVGGLLPPPATGKTDDGQRVLEQQPEGSGRGHRTRRKPARRVASRMRQEKEIA